ncbi:MAG: molybdenum cofactor guanylyltransferase [Pseudanabaenaceae cyanobacterium bins.68]|nr:molybdenum cofactor guanylyltransferase [Pseudanabaenaceae cyanobacterium bins.68]
MIAAIILAGGQSRRMGTDKALLCLKGKPLLQLQAETATACCDLALIVSDRDRALDLPAACEQVLELRPRAPLIGFHFGLTHLNPHAWVLLLACDLPLLTPELLATSIVDLEQITPENQAYLVKSEHKWQPFCGFYRWSCLASLDRYLANPNAQLSFQAWLRELKIVENQNIDPKFLWNCNTPRDWQELVNCLSPTQP